MNSHFEATITVKETSGTGKGNTYDLGRDLKGELTLEELLLYTKTALITIAAETLKDEQSRGFDPKPIVVVDSSTKKQIIDVKPLGKIEFISSQVVGLQVIEDIYTEILNRSKFVTGTYIQGNFVLLNGHLIATNFTELREWIFKQPKVEQGDIFRFVNVVPYARKLERYGVTAQRSKQKRVKSRDKSGRSGETILAANGTYFLASRAALKGYKNNVKISFEFILGSTLGITVPLVSNAGKILRTNYKASKAKPKNSGPYLYPSIKVVIGARGVV